MATKKFLELQEMSSEDLLSELLETRAQYTKMKFDHTIKGLDNPRTIRDIRRDLARLETEKRRRELAEKSTE